MSSGTIKYVFGEIKDSLQHNIPMSKLDFIKEYFVRNLLQLNGNLLSQFDIGQLCCVSKAIRRLVNRKPEVQVDFIHIIAIDRLSGSLPNIIFEFYLGNFSQFSTNVQSYFRRSYR
jgi:hypothetical protein